MKSQNIITLALCLFLAQSVTLKAQVRILPEVDTFLSSPRPDGIGDGVTTCCNANPVPAGEQISSHNVIEVDTNQGGNGPVEPLFWFRIGPELLERFALTEGAEATFQVSIVNGFDPLTFRRVTVDWLSIEGGGNSISRSTFPGAPADDLMLSAFEPGVNVVQDSFTEPNPAIPDQATGTVQFDVSSDVLAWAGGEPNYGWAASPGASQGGTLITVENEDIPPGLVEGIGHTTDDLQGLVPSLTLSGPGGTPLPFPFEGDFNRDGAVNRDDYAILATNFNSSGSFDEGDINLDDQIDLSDFVRFRSVFLAQNLGSEAAVPEPAGYGLMLIGVLGLLFRSSGRTLR